MKRVCLTGVIVALLGLAGLLAAQELAPRSASPPERLLKRVQEHFTLLQEHDWTKAEAYLTEDSKPVYRELPKSAFLSFRVGAVKMASSGLDADVQIFFKVFLTGTPAPVELPQNSHWKLLNDGWYRELEKPAASSVASPFDVSSQQQPPPPPQYLKFVGKRYSFGRFEQGIRKTARFPFTNVSDKVVRITDVDTRCDCLQVEGLKEAYKSGESGEIVIHFDSSRFLRDYIQTIFVHAEPDHQFYRLDVFGYVYAKGEGHLFEKQEKNQAKP